ncbi:MAG: alpha/beta hydrolase-fold protein [Candidatus Dormibacteria bacterium]
MRLHLPSARLPRRAAQSAVRLARRTLGPPRRFVLHAAAPLIRVAHRGAAGPLALIRRVSRAPIRLAGRHLTIVTAAATAALCALLAWLLGSGLDQWFVAQGMDNERADLLGAMVLVLIATAAVGAGSRRPAPTRFGGLVGFVGIQIVPFLVRAATTPPTPGLRYTEDLLGWILQPLGMLLLAVISVVVGAALGVGLARDAARLPSVLRRRRLWPVILLVIALIVAASGAAVTALQQGPLSALHDYDVIPEPTATIAATPAADPMALPSALPSPVTPPTPDELVLRQLPGQIQSLTIGGHAVDVYVPGLYMSDDQVQLPVLYLLHGTPGAQTDWLNGGGLKGVLDQMIAAGTIPPILAVLPNGNEPNCSDTEWGNSPCGDVETWLVDQVVPEIDYQYRTLGAAYRGIAGYSSGGFGAVNLAMRNPTLFTWAGSYSGYFVGRSAIFGTAWRANSPLYIASGVPDAERMPLYLGVGSQDYTYGPGTQQFAATLKAMGWFDYDLQTVPGGHGWVAWQAELFNSLTWLGELWGPTPWMAPPTPMAGPPVADAAGSPSAVEGR